MVAQLGDSLVDLITHGVDEMWTCAILAFGHVDTCFVHDLEEVLVAHGGFKLSGEVLNDAEDLSGLESSLGYLEKGIDEIIFRKKSLLVLIETSELVFELGSQVFRGEDESFERFEGVGVSEESIIFGDVSHKAIGAGGVVHGVLLVRTFSLDSSSRHSFYAWFSKVMPLLAYEIYRWFLISVIHTNMTNI